MHNALQNIYTLPANPTEDLYLKSFIEKEEINALPLVSFEGSIQLVTTQQQCEQATHILKKESILGFDTETRPAFKKGVKYEISLLQLSTENQVFLFRLNKIPFSGELVEIIASPSIIKAGVAVRDDIKGLQRLHSYEPAGFVELADMAKTLNFKNFGLRSLAALVLGKRVSKGNKLTNWENPTLTKDQQKYAATDAWISRELYQVMKDLKPVEESPPSEAEDAFSSKEG